MKLIYCPECKDLIRLLNELDNRFCICKKSWGRYRDNSHAIIGGKAIPIGLDNISFNRALKIRNHSIEMGMSGIPFDSFIIPHFSHTVKEE